VLSVILGAVAIGAVVLLVAIVPGAGAHEPVARRWLALSAIPVIVFQACLMQLLRGYDDHGAANIAWIAAPIVSAVGNGTLALTGGLTATAAVGMWVAGQTLGMSILLFALVRRHGGFGRGDLSLARRMLSFGVKTHGAQVMLLSNYRLDQWILGAVKGSTQLGIYSVAVAWAESLFFLPQALQGVQRPDLVRGTPEQAAWRAARISRMCLLLTGVLTIVMWVAAPFLCVNVFGAGFRGSVTELRILTLGSFGIAALKLLGDTLTSQRKPLLEMAAISVAFVFIVVLDRLLIPSHGGLGAAIASAIAYSAGGIAVVFIFVAALPARLRDLIPRVADLRWAIGRVRTALR
jgi:O-antigen/teichoic acid export membrane protein